ncbi:MAG: DUF1778 domain-containing protein [Gemmatimonadota bacterium]|nr:DUF1778 domain-containing protein [Gemmatimonadota bacterium]
MRTTTLRMEAHINDPAGVQQVERLRAVLGAGNAELLRESLQLLDWCVTQVREGRQIASVTDTGSLRELSMPTLERARAQARMQLPPEAFAQVTRLLDQPPAPTDALRDLMAGRTAAAR